MPRRWTMRRPLILLVLALAACRSTREEAPIRRVDARDGAVEVVAADFHALTLDAAFVLSGVAAGEVSEVEMVARYRGRVLAFTREVRLHDVDGGLGAEGRLLVANEDVAAAAPRADAETATIALHVVATALGRDVYAETQLEVPVLRAPVIELTEVRLDEHGPLEATLSVDLRVTNPNPWPLDFRSLRVVPRVDGARLSEVLVDGIGRLLFGAEPAILTIRATTRFTGDHAPLYDLLGTRGPHDVSVDGRATFAVDGPLSPLEARIDDDGRFSF